MSRPPEVGGPDDQGETGTNAIPLLSLDVSDERATRALVEQVEDRSAEEKRLPARYATEDAIAAPDAAAARATAAG